MKNGGFEGLCKVEKIVNSYFWPSDTQVSCYATKDTFAVSGYLRALDYSVCVDHIRNYRENYQATENGCELIN